MEITSKVICLSLVCMLGTVVLTACDDNPLGQSKIDSGYTSLITPPAPTPAPPAITATHAGWTGIKAVGSKTPAAQASDLSTTTASVTFSWAAMTLSEGVVDSYNVYRGGTSGGETLLATAISASSRAYTDTTVSNGVTYYYKVMPVSNGVVISPATVADIELKIMVPPANMVLMHRWAANQEMCQLMGRTSDRDYNYRCAAATGASAPPGTDGTGFVDVGASMFVDMFEQGCNYTATSACTDATVNAGAASACIGIRSTPQGNVTAAAGTVYYSRLNSTCFINTSAGTGNTWTVPNSATNAQIQAMASAQPGLPPFVVVKQTQAQIACNGQAIGGIPAPGTKRLLKRREHLLASAWSSALTDSAIDTLENGVNLDSTHNCNTNGASPQTTAVTDISGTNPTMAYVNSVEPSATNRDTLPNCRNPDCSAAAAGNFRVVRTGSNATSNCISRYGAQDMIGNAAELVSDQLTCGASTCTGVAATSNTVDSANDDMRGVTFDGSQSPSSGNTFASTGKIQLPLGLSVVVAFAGDGVVSKTSAQFHNDRIFLTPSAGTRVVIAGGRSTNNSNAGRFTMNLDNNPAGTGQDTGFRCIVPAE